VDPHLTDLTLAALKLTHLTPGELSQWIRDLWPAKVKAKAKVNPRPSSRERDSGSKTENSETAEV
jgi:hypothetical protein